MSNDMNATATDRDCQHTADCPCASCERFRHELEQEDIDARYGVIDAGHVSRVLAMEDDR